MSLEDRVRSSVDQALGTLVKQMSEIASEERETATRDARQTALSEAEQATQVRVAEVEARMRTAMDEAIAAARAEDREATAREIRAQVESDAEQRMRDALAAADTQMKTALAESEVRMKTTLAEAEARAAEALKQAVAAAHVRERDIEMADISRLLESIRGLDGASSLSEVLDALSLSAAREAARAAVVVLRGDRIHGWRLSGFGPRDSQPKSIDLTLAESGVIGLAVSAVRAVTTRDSQGAAAGPGFETLAADRMGLAVPVVVGGRVVAVVYADAVTLDGHERPVPSGWPEVVEMLARHAGRCLEALTTQRATQKGQSSGPGAGASAGASSAPPASQPAPPPRPESAPGAMNQITDGLSEAARRTARLLVSEIRLYHEPAVDEGRRDANLLARLAPEIREGSQRVQSTCTGRRPQPYGLFPAGTGPHPRGRRCDATRESCVKQKVPILVLLTTVAVGATVDKPAGLSVSESESAQGTRALPQQLRLLPTAHPPVPTELASMWYAPSGQAALTPALAGFVRGVRLLDEGGNAAAALPLVSAEALRTTQLADYARYYTGLALMRLDRHAAADTAFADLAARKIEGHLPEDAAFRQAEVREALQDFKGAISIYESLVTRKLAQPELAWLRLGLAADKGGLPMRSVEALQRAYYDYPTTFESDRAGAELDRQDVDVDADLAPRELARAEALFAARRWSAAKASYESVRPFVPAADRDRVILRLAACDVSMGRHREGRDSLRPLLEGPLADEANFHYINAVRGLKLKDEHVALARAFTEKFPSSPFGDQVLNDLASAFIIDDRDAEADVVFLELLGKYPAGRFAERAAWKAGWSAYRQGRFAEAVELFDRGSAQFPRSDYRPSWLYWSGRAAQQAGSVETGTARLRLAATDYHNSYYGRLALSRLSGLRGGPIAPSLQRQPATNEPPTARRIAMLLAVGLNQEAMNELRYAQRVWGDSPQLQATIALTYRRLGNVRAGINAMKRAYPQYLAAGGEKLPIDILQVIFPVDFWPLLEKYGAARNLDPYLLAALVAQESNFDPVVKSHASAIGLMQVLPSTGRSYARKLGVKPFSARRLTEAEVNVRIGTQIFADSIRKFGGVHFALAAYNAGDSRVVAWQRERPGMAQDEFIDDIPFPETQNYVKRILGTAEDYRYVYGSSDSR